MADDVSFPGQGAREACAADPGPSPVARMERSAIRGCVALTARGASLGQADCPACGGELGQNREFSHSAASQVPDVARLNGFQFVKTHVLVASYLITMADRSRASGSSRIAAPRRVGFPAGKSRLTRTIARRAASRSCPTGT